MEVHEYLHLIIIIIILIIIIIIIIIATKKITHTVNFALNARVNQSSYSMILMKQAENKVLPFNCLNFYLRISLATAM